MANLPVTDDDDSGGGGCLLTTGAGGETVRFRAAWGLAIYDAA